MMLFANEDSWITQLQDKGVAICGITASDDLGIVCDRLRSLADQAGIEVRIFRADDPGILHVRAK